MTIIISSSSLNGLKYQYFFYKKVIYFIKATKHARM